MSFGIWLSAVLLGLSSGAPLSAAAHQCLNSRDVVAERRSGNVLPRGVRNAVDDFGADPTGKTDSTVALQRALTAARTQNFTVYLPSGCYAVSDQLNATEPRNGRWQPVVIVGEKVGPGGLKPTLVLRPNTPRFTNAKAPRGMLVFQTDWCLAPGAEVAGVAGGCSAGQHQASPPYNFNQVIQSVDVVIGEGNYGAVGIVQRGAQGTTIEDVVVYAGSDAMAGIAGGNGGGGTFVGVTVYGGKVGLDARISDIPTVVALTLVNQSCAGVVFGADPTHRVSTTMAITGLVVRGSPQLGGLLAGIDLGDFGVQECNFPNLPVQWSKWGSVRAQPSTRARTDLSSPISVIDSSFEIKGGAPCVLANSSLYMSDVYGAGCDDIVRAGGRPPVRAPTDGAVAHIKLLAYGKVVVPSPKDEYAYAFPAYVGNATRADSALRFGESSKLPADLQSKHTWDSDTTPTWQTAGAVSALDAGAKGDGVTDDWAALQRAVDANRVVVLPKGFYRLSQPLVLRKPGAALVGVGRTLSFLIPSSSFAGEAPILDVAREAEGATVGFLTLATFDSLPLAFAARWAAADGLWRQVFTTRWAEADFPPLEGRLGAATASAPSSAPSTYNRALVEISGGGAFYSLNLDFGCCFGTLIPRAGLPDGFTCDVPVPNLNPGISSLQEILVQGGGYRTLLINGSTDGLRMYAHNTEQDMGDAHTEIRWSKNVTLYSAKSEGNYVAIWIRDSDGVTVHGFGGDASAFPNTTQYPTGRAQFRPSLFRVQRSRNVRLANLIDNGRITDDENLCTLVAAGTGTDPRFWNTVLWQDWDGVCGGQDGAQECTTTRVLDRPVLWEWDGA